MLCVFSVQLACQEDVGPEVCPIESEASGCSPVLLPLVCPGPYPADVALPRLFVLMFHTSCCPIIPVLLLSESAPRGSLWSLLCLSGSSHCLLCPFFKSEYLHKPHHIEEYISNKLASSNVKVATLPRTDTPYNLKVNLWLGFCDVIFVLRQTHQTQQGQVHVVRRHRELSSQVVEQA